MSNIHHTKPSELAIAVRFWMDFVDDTPAKNAAFKAMRDALNKQEIRQ